MHSIRTKITLATSLAIVITMVVATLLGVGAIREVATGSAEETLYLLCETGDRNLDSYFESVEQSVDMAAAYVESDIDGLDDTHLQAHLDRVSEIFERVMVKSDGVLTYYYRIDPEVSTTTQGFWYVRQSDGSFQEHAVTDISQYDTSDTSSLVWFTGPKATGKPDWQPPYITENLGERVISYNLPIYYEGVFVGVVGIEIDYSTLAEQVNNITLYDNGYAFICEPDGTLIYHPRIDVSSLKVKPTVPDGLLGDETLVKYTFESVEKIAVWQPLENGMRLYVTVPVSEVDAVWRSWSINITLTFLVMLIVFVAVIMASAKRLAMPLHNLTLAAEQVNQGDYDVALDYNGNDEVGTLTQAFNHLVAHLKTYIDDLNDRVYIDALTSLRNKGAFDQFMEELEEKASDPNNNVAFAVCVFDCNSLKEINDRFGHDKGDIYLQDTSRVICDVFDHSPVFRIGGDEFVAILQGRDYEERDELIKRFDTTCSMLRQLKEGRWQQVDAARGLAVYDPAEDESVNDVVRRADKLMYENKWFVKEMRGEA